jgi:tripartite-type tricarboxylate transporter receptor subunit TctC
VALFRIVTTVGGNSLERFVSLLLALTSLLLVRAEPGWTQTYPVKPIRIVTTEVGSATEIVARMIAQKLSPTLGQQLIIDNRGIIAGEIVSRAVPDGYTLLSYGSPLWLSPLMRDVPYDPVADFAPITLTAAAPNILVVHPSLPARSVKELIALAKARPGELNYASSSTGGSPHLAGELFKSMAKVNIVRVPYKGAGPALIALMGGELQLMFPAAGAVTPYVKAGKLRALATTSLEPSPLAPGLPTMAAAGLPGYETASLLGVFAPARTPAAIVSKLHREIAQTLRSTEIRERLFALGMEAVGSTPEQTAATIKGEIAKWSRLIKEAGIRE